MSDYTPQVVMAFGMPPALVYARTQAEYDDVMRHNRRMLWLLTWVFAPLVLAGLVAGAVFAVALSCALVWP